MTDTQPIMPLSDVELEALYLSPATFNEISEGAKLLVDLADEQIKFLFEAALQHGTHVRYWFQRSQSIGDGSDGWKIIEQKITDENARFEQAENSVKLLGEIKNEEAVELLGKALQQEALAPFAVRVLAEISSKDALAILKEELFKERLGDLVIDGLSQVKNSEAVDLIGSALDDHSRRPRAEISLTRLSKNKTHPFSGQAAEILSNWRQKQTETKTEVPEPVDSVRRGGLGEPDWDLLLRRIRDGKCLPLLGQDVSAKYYPSYESIARQWADEEDYPLPNRDLPSVAEFLSVQYEPDYLRERFQREYQEVRPPDFSDSIDALALFARLPLRVFLTTTYDELLVRALRQNGKRPRLGICRWHKYLTNHPDISDTDTSFVPSVEEPLVFHLFGQLSIPESLVLTSRDYLEFLINLSKDSLLIPNQVARAMAESTILFLGFPFPDHNSNILFSFVNRRAKTLQRSNKQIYILRASVKGHSQEQQVRAQDYLDRYFEAESGKLFRGTLDEFSAELRQRWQQTLS